MKLFKLTLSNYDKDLHFGLPNDCIHNEYDEKLNIGLSKIKPWMYGIPYYNDSKIAFVSKDAFFTFLFNVCEFEKDDIDTLENLGYYIEQIDTPIIDTGFSKIICSYKEDEMNCPPSKVMLKNISKNIDYRFIPFFANVLESKDVQHIKNKYYKNAEIFF